MLKATSGSDTAGQSTPQRAGLIDPRQISDVAPVGTGHYPANVPPHGADHLAQALPIGALGWSTGSRSVRDHHAHPTRR